MKLEKEWRDVVGYRGEYSISEDGDIFSNKIAHPNKLRQVGIQGGYRRLVLWLDRKGKNHLIHRLVYEAFIGSIPEGYIVHHLDGDKLNNNFRNLILMKVGDHIKFHNSGQRSRNSKFTQEQVNEIRERYKTETIWDIAISLKESYVNIQKIVLRKSWKGDDSNASNP